ncbi:MAG: DUF6737 family protein [Leptolyngbya sp. IPPAS B-1204]|uniref:DUF6737 domain-containing protein n=1 Tax=Leptolyngbya sp. NK1-12 TaxID=2547451 RepID=A0AA96WN26_9CYAN|nr:hypothetical protein [Elainella sp. C42_A2020_010]RNJ65051.1 MAG: hypothetical protein EDM05_33160 [Leptolyngbya sp. IPPAS B-1204]WNZ25476.1 hypothetical protein HJG54_23230 [Leptolyngbya sp. NK1-12]
MSSGLERTSIWQYKPWWCQPWSILLTGMLIISGSWFWLHRVWLTGLVAMPVLVWMGFFLLIYPKLMNQMLADAAEQVIQQPTEVKQAEQSE